MQSNLAFRRQVMRGDMHQGRGIVGNGNGGLSPIGAYSIE